ncbi:MAG: rod shape-determining protein RodA [Endomicrobium sp.]|jgi:rod shape determining protein RodA|nr:rod shape-determining protein RodA [Endomicrobium sp.]
MSRKIVNIAKNILLPIDFKLVFPVIILIFIGFMSIYSACSSYNNMLFGFLLTQLLAFGLGIIGLVFTANFNYRYYKRFDRFIYILSIVILILVLIFGSVKKGAKSWFDFGFALFQPVEIVKIMFILSVASFIDKKSEKINNISFFIVLFAMFIGHVFFIMMQPDFSSTLSYFPVLLILLFVAGANKFYLFYIIVFIFFSVSIPILNTFFNTHQQLLFSQNKMFLLLKSYLFNIIYVIIFVLLSIIICCLYFSLKLKVKKLINLIILCTSMLFGCLSSIVIERSLKDYQKKRIMVFLNPAFDPVRSGYNIAQSKIAIGSGGLIGKGFKKGTQTQLCFLPEKHTDFIFSVIAEEGGLILSQITLFFYFILISRAFVIAKKSNDRYGSIVAIGIITMFVFYIVINICMSTGIIPVVGVPLPFISYGGSSIFSSMCAIGILCSINNSKRLRIYI